MVIARRDFLKKGYYYPLKKAVEQDILMLGKISSYLDAGCGEGYYTECVIPYTDPQKCWAIDISKDALILAYKRIKNINYAVASVYDMPFFEDNSFDLITDIFSPFAREEFIRVLKSGGYLISVIPAKNHLFGIKKLIYDTPYENAVKPFEEEGFERVRVTDVNYNITLSSEDALTLWKMTPYYYRTPKSGLEKLKSSKEISTDISFHIITYKSLKE